MKDEGRKNLTDWEQMKAAAEAIEKIMEVNDLYCGLHSALQIVLNVHSRYGRA